MRIFLIRHGQTQWNLADRAQYNKPVPLNKTGKAQAAHLAHHFKDIPLTHVYASPTLRTMQTARAIAKSHSLIVIAIKDFIERNPGTLVGLSSAEIHQKIPDLDAQRARDGIDWRPPCGETIREVTKRILKKWRKLLKKHRYTDALLIVTHGLDIKIIVHYIHGGKAETIFHTRSFENAEIVEISYNGCSCKIMDKA